MSIALTVMARRVARVIPVLLGIISLNFFLLHLAPGDAADVLAGEAGSASPAYIAQLKSEFRLDRPLHIQFLTYVERTLSLDLGFSFRYNMSVRELIASRLGPTLLLMTTAFCLSAVAGTGLGILAGTKPNSPRDLLISLLTVVLYATPLFWIGLMLILVVSLKWHLLPTSGMETIGGFYEGWARVSDIAKHLVLPSLTLSFYYLAVYARVMRASVLEQTRMDYVLTARAKGATEGRIARHHILRNAILPVVTIAGIQAGGLLGGSVVVESVFGWPGLGLLAFESLFARDLNLLLGIFLLCAVLVIAVNLCVDLLYIALDPRIQLVQS
jgi:peptide/nickel transport system permease protein